jgi:hypothetical protein
MTTLVREYIKKTVDARHNVIDRYNTAVQIVGDAAAGREGDGK